MYEKKKIPLRECDICFDQKSPQNFIKLNCNHHLCIQCFIKWRKMKHTSCPFCRKEFLLHPINMAVERFPSFPRRSRPRYDCSFFCW